MSEKKSVEIKTLKPGGFVLVDDAPMRVEKVQKSKAGKHGAAKVRLFAKEIFGDGKRNIVKPGSTRVDVPIIEKKVMQVVALVGANVQLMDLDTYEMHEVAKPDFSVAEGDEVLVWVWGSYFMIKSRK